VISANLGCAATAWAGAAMTVLAIGLVSVSLRLHKSRSRVVARSTDQTPAEARAQV
jgi:DHA1 family chloramphenicol resistance protein-like MFS transporter